MSKVILKNNNNELIVKCIGSETITLADGDFDFNNDTIVETPTDLVIRGIIASVNGGAPSTIERNATVVIAYEGNINWTQATGLSTSFEENSTFDIVITQGASDTTILYLSKQY